MRWRADRERGMSEAVELVFYASLLLVLVAVMFYGARIAMANQAVSSAAAEGARSATLMRTAGQAQKAASAAVSDALDGEGLRCSSRSVDANTAGFAAPVGTPAQVTVSVTCQLNNADLVPFHVPGSVTITHGATSPLDTYRVRG